MDAKCLTPIEEKRETPVAVDERDRLAVFLAL
jgi:hypothetical protein